MSTSKPTPSERAVEEKIPWLLIIPLSILLSFFGTIWYALLPRPFYTLNSLGAVTCGLNEFIGTPFFILMIFYGIQFLALKSGLLKKKANLATLTYLYVTGMGVGYYINEHLACVETRGLATRLLNPTNVDIVFPEFMAPPAELAKQYVTGASNIPWIDWMPFISFYSIFYIIFIFYLVSIASIFRRQWIDVEKLPFPHTLPAYQLILATQTTNQSKGYRLTKPFLIGIILGLFAQMPITLAAVFPWFPDIYMWRTDTCAHGGWFVRPGNPLASIAGIASLNKNPISAALAYFAPLNVLLSALIFWVIFLIAVQVSYMMGYYTGILDVPGCCRQWVISPLKDPPLYATATGSIGGLIGLVLSYLILNRRYVADTVRAALGRGELCKYENEEPMTYRMSYIILIVSAIAAIILFMFCGLSLPSAILILVSAFVFIFAQIRLIGTVGVSMRMNWYGNFFHRVLLWPEPPSPMTRDCALATDITKQWISDTPTNGWPTLWTGFMSYKMASLTGVRARDALKVLLVSSIISAITIQIAIIWTGYTFGATSLPALNRALGVDVYAACSTPEAISRFPTSGRLTDWMPNVLAGMVIVLLLGFVHARFIWFPLEPIGFIVAFSIDSVQWGMAVPFFAAWVTKTLTLRIGGSKAYEEYGMPTAGGFIVGCLIASLVGGAMLVVRFFYPY